MLVKALLVGASITSGFILSMGSTASAQFINGTTAAPTDNGAATALALLRTHDNEHAQSIIRVVTAAEQKAATEAKAPENQPITHTVIEGDTLSSIAELHDTTWMRLWQKNRDLTHPDKLAIDDKLTIPAAEETLQERELPAPPEPVLPAAAQVAAAPARPAAAAPAAPVARTAAATISAPASSAGNRYTPGYCTWYVKNRRPDLPNNLGNADTWVARAAAQGLATGSAPRAGAVGQRGMHVVYVESVNGDGTVNISEMNHAGLYVITHRTLPGSYFSYIY